MGREPSTYENFQDRYGLSLPLQFKTCIIFKVTYVLAAKLKSAFYHLCVNRYSHGQTSFCVVSFIKYKFGTSFNVFYYPELNTLQTQEFRRGVFSARLVNIFGLTK